MNMKPIHMFFKKHQNLTNYCFLAIVFTTSYRGILIFFFLDFDFNFHWKLIFSYVN